MPIGEASFSNKITTDTDSYVSDVDKRDSVSVCISLVKDLKVANLYL